LQGSTLAKEKTCETTTSNFANHGHAKKNVDDKLHIQKNSFILQVKIYSKWDISNHLLVYIYFKWTWLTCYIKGNRVSIGIQGLNIITLPSQTSYTLQPLDVSCSKPFKTMFRKESDLIMTRSKYSEPNKITLIGRVDKGLRPIVDQTKHQGMV
jgi:hypothetical protein